MLKSGCNERGVQVQPVCYQMENNFQINSEYQKPTEIMQMDRERRWGLWE